MSLALVVAAKGPCHAAPFLEALAAAGALADPRLEAIVVQDGASSLDLVLPAAVQQIRTAEAASVFELWGRGVAAASARHVAILDIHCPPAPGWFAAVLAHLTRDPDAFHGAVEPAYGPSDPRVTGYLVEYVQFHRPVARDMTEVAGVNFVIRRDLAGDPAALATEGFVKTLALERLAERPPLLRGAVVRHAKPFSLASYCRRRYRHGRCFAAQRMRGPDAPPRLLAALFTPLLPALRVWRIHRHARRIEDYRRAFWRRLPQIVAAETAWSFGEGLGYLAGDGGRRERLD